jgi:dienelactone hydrolase
MIARTLALLAACCTLAAAAQGIARDEYKAQRLRVQNQLATSKDRCSSVSGHSRDLCKVQAQADYDVARADLLARYKPTPRNRQKAQQVKARSEYRIAREKCGDLDGQARKVCDTEAQAGYAAAKAELRARQADTGSDSLQAQHARDKTRESATQARFDAQRERCSTLAGEAKADCMADAKKRFSIP